MTVLSRPRIALAALAAIAVVVTAIVISPSVHRVPLPLTNADVIRAQAAEKHLDPALIAAVIYAESKFDPRTSPAGAEGLMQVEPATAYFLAGLSGGVRFTAADLATPSVNVAYGSYYLRYLLDHYGGDLMLALAAYNAGLTNVDTWVARAHANGESLTEETIPFSETREYVRRVLSAQRNYRAMYARQLGLE
jgi:soluble lytic murein transglycosylase